MILSELLAKAKILTNFEVDATGATALWPTDKLYKAECPAGKRWFLMPSVTYRDVSSTLFVYLYDASANIIAYLGSFGAGTGRQAWPEYDAATGGVPIIINAGQYIGCVFATSQGATASSNCNVLEISI